MPLPEIHSGAMMIREGLLLPDSAHLDSCSYSDSWRLVVELDSFAIDCKLHTTGVHLIFIAGEWKVIELGWGAAAIRRGVQRLLNRARNNHLNCMEISQVASSRFLGFLYVAIRAHSFHIQNDAVLRSSA